MSNCGYNKNTVCHYFTYIYVYVLFCLTESFLNNRFQKKALNDQTSKWLPVIARVPQRSILGPFFPLNYVNDLPDHLLSTAELFADDTSYFLS